jgi:L-ascorbate metabolism protein UlaG (beta-lactamase superfamily)
MKRLLRRAGAVLLWTVVALCLFVTIVPRYLDRIYYRGPVSAHFDGAHFFNPDGDDDRVAAMKGPPWGLLWKQITGDPTRPVWPGHVTVTLAKVPERVAGERMLVTWVGHATLLVQTQGLNILTDPVWSQTAGPFGIGPTRVAQPGIRFGDLPKIDLVLVSHNHYDHMDLATLKQLWARDKPAIVTSLGNDTILRSAGIEAVGLDWGQTHSNDHDAETPCIIGMETGDGPCFRVTVTRNHHWDSRWFTDRNRALWSSFVVTLPGGNVFFSGDTGLGDGKWPEEAAALGPIRFAAIPIGAFRFQEGEMAGGSHVGPAGAIRIWNGLGRPQAIPIHWGTFRLSREGYDTPPRMLDAMLRCAGADPRSFAAVRIGEPVTIAPMGARPPAPDIAAIDACQRAGRFDAMR